MPRRLFTATGSGLPIPRGPSHLLAMGAKSRETIYGGSIRAAAERATQARKEADPLTVEAWNKRMLGFQGPAQPSPTLGDALNAGYPISKSGASAATPTKPSPFTSCGDRRGRRSTSWSATYAARIPAKAGIADADVEQALTWSSALDFER